MLSRVAPLSFDVTDGAFIVIVMLVGIVALHR
jgi:hypothetical protein